MKKYFKKMFKGKQKEFYELLEDNLKNEKKMFIVTANPETFMKAEKNKEYSKIILDKGTTVIADGIGSVLGANFLGQKVKERIPGVDTTLKLLELGNKYKKTVYLFGTYEEILQKTIQNIKRDYPNLKIIGHSNGYPESKDEIMDKIVKKEPDIALLSLGVPIQEEYISKYITKVKKGIYMGIGGTFDVLSGEKKRAPKIFMVLRCEWLYRIVKEPNRMKRFYNNNIKFGFKIVWQMIFKRKEKNEKA